MLQTLQTSRLVWSRPDLSLAETRRVGRTNIILLIMGVGGCVLLSVIMQRAVDLGRESARSELVRAFDQRFARTLSAPTTDRWVESEKGRLLVLSCSLAHVVDLDRAVTEMGTFVWGRSAAECDAVVVDVLTERSEQPQLFQVFPPRSLRLPNPLPSLDVVRWPVASTTSAPR